MLWRKPDDKKYTDLCIYVDEHIKDIVNPGENPEIENMVYNFLFLIIKAIAIKKCMFKNFQDYDAFSFYGANRIYFAIRKNYWNQGKVIKGKLIRPIKSCLNYIKALMYPMKVEYQNENFKETMSDEFLSQKIESIGYVTDGSSSIKNSTDLSAQFFSYLESSFQNIRVIINKVLKNSPFQPNTIDYQHLKITLILNVLNSIRIKNKLDADMSNIILWKLPKSMISYIKIILKEFYIELKQEIMECYRLVDIDDVTVSKIIQTTSREVLGYNEQDD